MQIPAPFDYARARSVDDAIALLEEHGEEARLVAGGHSLLPMMKLGLATPEMLIDINDLTDLTRIRVDGDVLRIGAMVRHADLLSSAVVGEQYRMLHEAERVIADPVVRNRGTVGGSLCHADPAEDLSAALGALRAECVVRGSGGERVVPLRELATGPYETVLQPAEMLTEVRIPIRPGAGSAYLKVERRAGDWAVASAGAVVWLDGRRSPRSESASPRWELRIPLPPRPRMPSGAVGQTTRRLTWPARARLRSVGRLRTNEVRRTTSGR
jgi:carbon-monoxide dehydrogenase medium subunit